MLALSRRSMVKPEKRRWQDLSTKQRGALVVLGALELGLAAAAWTDLARREPAEVRGALAGPGRR
jgi:hypothetical protein